MNDLTTEGPCWSRETPITVKPLSAYFFWIATNPGISARHGGPQVAQKPKVTPLPLKSESFTLFPSKSLKGHYGAALFKPAPRDRTPPRSYAAPVRRSATTPF